MLHFWNNWHVKKCCNEFEKCIDSWADGYWIDDGKLMVIMHEGDPELETVFELERCDCCGAKIVCYQTVNKIG